jgi:phytanoyl-CoA dioxygenase PhyH
MIVTATIRKDTPEFDEIDKTQYLSNELFREGFVSLSQVTSSDDIDFIRSELTSLLDDQTENRRLVRNLGDTVANGRDGRILEVVSPSALRPRLLESLFFQRALEISRAILGPSAQLRFDHSISKPPHNTAATDWHQDIAYRRLTRSPRRLHWWLPLQDVNIDNGCMQFVPRSHIGPILPHAPRSAKAHAIKASLPSNATPVACPLKVGGATVHLPKTLHGTGPNNSGEARHAWVIQIGIWNWFPSLLH